MRTSEAAYLQEAFAFYHSIRARPYFSHATKEDRSEVLVKRLRYYARFIVVSLLLNRFQLVDDLVRELDHQIIKCGVGKAADQAEWTVMK